MLLKHTGRQESICHSFEGKKYLFHKRENKGICEVPEELAFELMQEGMYMPILPEPKVEKKEEVAVPAEEEMAQVAEEAKAEDNLPKDSLIPKKRGRPKKAKTE